MKPIQPKSFYLITSLTRENSYDELKNRKRFETLKEAQEAAKNLVQQRRNEGRSELSFYILKAIASVGPIQPPIEILKLK